MTLPAFILGMIFSSLYGAAFHLIKGGNLAHLLAYLIVSWVGFWVGHVLANSLGITIARLGPLNLGAATLISLIFLGIGHWLSVYQVER